MAESRKTLFTKRIYGGKDRSYFFDVHQSEKSGKKYLVMSESRNVEGSWTSSRLLIFPEQLGVWKQTFDEAIQILQDDPAKLESVF